MAKETNNLQHTWVLWEHKQVSKSEDWANSMREVCEFSTVEGEFFYFWEVAMLVGGALGAYSLSIRLVQVVSAAGVFPEQDLDDV